MKLLKFARRLHKISAVIVGIQIVLWMLSGLYMTAVPIDIVRGNHLVKDKHLVKDNDTQTVDSRQLLPWSEINKLEPNLVKLELSIIRNRPVYNIKSTQNSYYLDAITGKTLNQLTEIEVLDMVSNIYIGEGEIAQVSLIKDKNVINEIRGRHLPVWQVTYDDFFESTVYISATTAQVVAVRSDIWRMFDFLWMLHIMDYDTRDDFNNPLVIFMASLGMFLSLSGLLLLFNGWRRYGVSFFK